MSAHKLIRSYEKNPTLEDVGGKGLGLFRLKEAQEAGLLADGMHLRFKIPDFFIVPPKADLDESLLQATARDLGSTVFAVRSSYHLEDSSTKHNFDGIFTTRLNVPSSELVDAITTVRRSVASDPAIKYAADTGIDLVNQMPVIVQVMISDPEYTGVIYSKFPSSQNITKSIVTPAYDDGYSVQHVDIFRRKDEGPIPELDIIQLIASSAFEGSYSMVQMGLLHNNLLTLETYFGYPVRVEFAVSIWDRSPDGKSMWATADTKTSLHLLQARRISKQNITSMQMTKIDSPGLLGHTRFLSKEGDVTKVAFVYGSPHASMQDIVEFDRTHPDGYILFCPFLQFYHTEIDHLTQNKSAVVAFTSGSRHHDMDIAAQKDLLYLGFGSARDSTERVNTDFGLSEITFIDHPQVLTGDTVRVFSDGIDGYVYNLSRPEQHV